MTDLSTPPKFLETPFSLLHLLVQTILICINDTLSLPTNIIISYWLNDFIISSQLWSQYLCSQNNWKLARKKSLQIENAKLWMIFFYWLLWWSPNTARVIVTSDAQPLLLGAKNLFQLYAYFCTIADLCFCYECFCTQTFLLQTKECTKKLISQCHMLFCVYLISAINHTRVTLEGWVVGTWLVTTVSRPVNDVTSLKLHFFRILGIFVEFTVN